MSKTERGGEMTEEKKKAEGEEKDMEIAAQTTKPPRKTRKDKGKKREKVYVVTVGGDEIGLTVLGRGKTAQQAWNNAASTVAAGAVAECWQRVGTPKTAQLTFGNLRA